MSTISRRAFLKTVGVGALSVAAMSVLAGCDVAGTQTPVVDAATVEAKVGNTYKVADLLSVNVAADPTATDKWIKAYAAAYEDRIPDKNAYDAANDALKALAKKEAEEAASIVAADTATVKFTVTNYGDPIVLAESGKTGEFTSSAFTASSNGTSVKCTIDKAYLNGGTNNTARSADVTCKVTLPANAKNFEVVVTMPGADKILKYTFENDKYKVLDPSKAEFYNIHT